MVKPELGREGSNPSPALLDNDQDVYNNCSCTRDPSKNFSELELNLRKRYIILAAAVALTLAGAPTLAYATDGMEETSSPATPTPTPSPTSPTTPPITTSTTTPIPTVAPDTLSPESPVVSPQPTESSASGPTTEASLSGSKPQESSPPASPTATPTTAEPTAPEFKYVLVVWENAAGAPKFPQYLVQWYLTNNTEVNVLPQWATKCGTFYQSDLYANDAQTAKLLERGVLDGGWESWPKNSDGSLNMRYDTLTTPPCPVVEPEPEPTEPEVTPSPSTPTAPEPSISPSNPTGTTPSTPASTTGNEGPQPSTGATTGPATAPKAIGTTTDRPVAKADTSSSLAYTGADNGPIVGLAVLLVFVGALGFVLAKNRKRK